MNLAAEVGEPVSVEEPFGRLLRHLGDRAVALNDWFFSAGDLYHAAALAGLEQRGTHRIACDPPGETGPAAGARPSRCVARRPADRRRTGCLPAVLSGELPRRSSSVCAASLPSATSRRSLVSPT